MMKKSLLVITSILVSLFVSAQDILITDPDQDTLSPFNCGSYVATDMNFYDAGGAAGNYNPNENEVIVLCPNSGGSKMSVGFSVMNGFTWDIDGSDTLYIYDGPSIMSPLLDAINTVTHPGGNQYTASWTNTTGCLTLHFISDGAVEGTGWGGNASCKNPPQPIEIHMEAFIGNGEANGQGDATNDLTPADTGYVDVCFGDSVMFVATPVFHYEPGADSGALSGGGYVQTGNFTANWIFSDGTTVTGDTAWFTPPTRNGYLVQLTVQDTYPQVASLISRVRVSTIPSFATCHALNDDLCVGQTTELIGGISAIDTAGVDPTQTDFSTGGSFAGLTFLPDGNGVNYTTSINIAGFQVGDTIADTSDIVSVCVDMEHTFLGDLEMWLTCPDGTQVTIFNSYTGAAGAIPGGFGGGGTYLGDANDDPTVINPSTGATNPGTCWTYCFSDSASNASWAALTFSGGIPTTPVSTGSAVTAGDYQPEEPFANFIGCPINGTWTITVRDSWNIDDGYICGWGITFDPNLNPYAESYSPEIVNEFWHQDPTIIEDNFNDTTIVIQHDTAGTYNYIFEVMDNFGCSYDTTIVVLVSNGPEATPLINTCLDSTAIVSGTVSAQGGYWFIGGPGNASFVDGTTNTNLNPHITVDQSGSYLFNFVDTKCQDTVVTVANFFLEPTVEIEYEGNTNVERIVICTDDKVSLKFNATDSDVFTWDPIGGNADSVLIEGNGNLFTVTNGNPDSVLVSITASGVCGTAEDNVMVVVEECEIPNVITPNGDGINEYFYTKYAEFYTDVELVIYNRWGKVVFKTESYQNDWSGQRKESNQQVSSGTYYYVMRWNEGTKDASGTITVFDSK